MALVLGMAPVLGQPPVSPLPLEELRDLARKRIQEMREEFEKDLVEAVRILRGSDPSTESRRAREARALISPWAPAFPKQILEVMKSQVNPFLRTHLAAVLAETGDQSLTPHLLEALEGADPELAGLLVELLGLRGSPESVSYLQQLLIREEELPAFILGEVLLALARLGSAQAAPAARSHLTHEDPAVRAYAIQALAQARAEPHQDAAAIVALAQEDPSREVRAQALRSLRRFPDNLDVQRVLHDTVVGGDPLLVAAALQALEKVANRETSRRYLLETVQGTIDLTLREQAARLLAARLGDPRGARLLAKAYRELADKNLKDRDAQVQAGDQHKKLGAYADAIDYYRRALPLTPRSLQYEVRVPMARCYALMGRFEDAKKLLLADYKDLSRFVEDPDLEEMRRDPRYAPLFRPDESER